MSIAENIEPSLLLVMQLRKLGVETIVAKAVTPLHGRILEKRLRAGTVMTVVC